MASLSEKEKAEFLEDSRSELRCKEFGVLRERAERVLSVDELLDFLNWSQQFMSEDVSKRGPIRGDRFLM